MAEGDELNNSMIAAATAIAMTFIVNFPIAWIVIHYIVKGVRKKPGN
ncbi:ABC-type sulfate transport system permease component [Peribacillus deserti]|uniref:ABC-type sulfate transport system permease component n=1 Tax=Peribacillus deserti TaxID=673318 RepID=A0ABS2QCF8_9BACI|nr:hypothetical protein [Peribacillus deserti]MBM7690842.1 ABC-type sulfate transport system permease component [Peribacillus deserti]